MAPLVALYQRKGDRATRADFERIREQLLALAEERYRDDPHYRTVASIESQYGWIRWLAEERPRARDAPRAFREAWSRYRTGAPLIDEIDTDESGAALDRRELIRILERLRTTLAELVGSEYIPDRLRGPYAAAWADLEKRGYIQQAIVGLRGPAVDDLLAAHGLVGPQREAKTESVEQAVRDRHRRRGWGPLKALLGYLDSILGSLASVFPWLEPVKEFKEITESSADVAGEAPPFKGH